jgi:hypothetical protein
VNRQHMEYLTMSSQLWKYISACAMLLVQIQGLAAQTPVYIENRGQWDSQAQFLLRSNGLDLWITDRGVVYDIARTESNDSSRAEGIRRDAISMTFSGAGNTITRGEERAAGHHNYFIGNDSTKWAMNVPLYNRARIEHLYDGIDALFYLDAGRPRYDLIIAPGADASQVRMEFQGAEKLYIDANGSLVIGTALGEIRQRELYAYQLRDGVREQVACRFRLKEGVVCFDVGSYDRTRMLVIDPVVIVYSTYLGGSTGMGGSIYADETGWDIAADKHGRASVTGVTRAIDFPTRNAWKQSSAGSDDVFVTTLTPEGTLAWSTYFGGETNEQGEGIAVDDNGNVYVTGSTGSYDFPVLNPAQPAHAGGGGSGDAFVVKFNSEGIPVYATYLGGSGVAGDIGLAIAVDHDGNAYVAGRTSSFDFPTKNAAQSQWKGGEYDAFVTTLTATGAYAYSTYLGGSSIDEINGIAVEDSSNVFVTGLTHSANFPTLNARQPATAGPGDAFVTKLTSEGALAMSSYLGGSAGDIGMGIDLDGIGNIYITGTTSSTDFPIRNAFQSVGGGDVSDLFVTKLLRNGELSYSTYLGGSNVDAVEGIDVDAVGVAVIGGSTTSTDFPMMGAVQNSHAGGTWDAFIAGLAPNGMLAFSSYLGDFYGDYGWGVAVDGIGNAYITGSTGSADFPTKNPLQPSLAGGGDAFVTKLSVELGSMSVERGAFQPKETNTLLRLDPLMPQPADDHLTVRFVLRHPAQVTLEVYAADGTLAAVTMIDRSFDAGEHNAIVATGALQPGSYLLRLRAKDNIGTERFIVVR